jgi:hypothetical protein
MFIINLDEETIIELHKRDESVSSLEDVLPRLMKTNGTFRGNC